MPLQSMEIEHEARYFARLLIALSTNGKQAED